MSIDGSNWKRVLLYWVNQSGLLVRTFYNLEQTDIEEFYSKYRDCLTNSDEVPGDLIEFLKENYPEFEPHLDDKNEISYSEYMYVYSVLLHYSCVRNPQEYFHKICQGFDEVFQQAIASFFKLLLEKEILNKTNLRHVIGDATLKIPLSAIPTDSPIRTPRTKAMPPTPKTTMLEERTKELNHLRAQIETEKYEKGLLEVQLRQQEDKIRKLSEDYKRHLTEIHDLKNELLTRTTENCSPNKNIKDEQIKTRLRKEIIEKDEIILNLQESLQVSTEEKSLLTNKLNYSEKQVKNSLEKIKELHYVVNDLKSEMEKKDDTIRMLSEAKNDLEQFINETRSPQGYRNDLNMSAECLDISLSRATNSSGSISSPENLGCSVIDIQLREKENENLQLREEIEKMRNDENKLAKHICDLISKYADIFEICNQNFLTNEDAGLTETFVVFEYYITNLAKDYKTTSSNLKQLKEETNILVNESNILSQRIVELEKNISIYEDKIQSVQYEKDMVEKRKKELHGSFEECLQNFYDATKTNEQLVWSLDQLKTDYEQLKTRNESSEQSYLKQIEQLSTSLVKKSNDFDEIAELNSTLYSQIETLTKQLRSEENNCASIKKLLTEAETKHMVLEDTKSRLSNELSEMQANFEQEMMEVKKIREERDKIFQERIMLIDSMEILKINLKNIQVDYENKEDSFRILQTDLSVMRLRNEQLNDKNKELADSNKTLNTECEKLRDDVKQLTNNSVRQHQENAELNKKLKEVNNKNESLIKDHSQEKIKLNSIMENHEKRINDYAVEIDKMGRTIDKLTNDLKDHEEQNQNMLDSIKDKENEIQYIVSINNALLTEKNNLQDELKSIKDNLLKKIESLVVDSKTFKDEISIVIQTLRDAVEDENWSGESAIFVIDSTDSITNQLKLHLNNYFEKNLQLKNKSIEFGKQCCQLQASLEQVLNEKSTISERFEELATKLGLSGETILALELKKFELDKKIIDLEKDVYDYQETCNDLSNSNEKLKTTVNELEKNLDKIKCEKSELIQKLGAIEAENGTILKKSESLKCDLDKSRYEIDTLKASTKQLNEQLKEEVSKLETQLNDWKNDALIAENQVKILSVELNNVELKKLEMSGQIEMLSNDLNSKCAFISSLEHENNNLKLQIEEISANFSNLQEKFDKAMIQHSEKTLALTSNVKALDEGMIALINQNENIQQELENNKRSLTNAIETLSDFETKIEKLNAENDVLKQLNDQLDGKIKNLEKSNLNFSSIKDTLQALEEEKVEIEVKLQQTLQECNRLKEILVDVVNQAKIINEEKEKILRENDELSSNLLSNISEKDNYRIQVNILEEEVKNIQNERNALKNTSVELEKQLFAKEKSYDEIELKYKFENNKLIESYTKLDENNKNLNKRLEKVSIKLGDAQAKASKLEKENDLLKKNIETIQKTASKYQSECTSLKTKLSSLQKSYDEITTQKETLKSSNTKYQEEIEKLLSKESTIKGTLKQTENEKRELKENINNLTETISKLTESLELTKAENLTLNEANAAFALEIEELKNQLSNHAEKEEMHLNDIQAFQKSQNKLTEVTQNLILIKNENMSLKEINEQMQKDTEELREENTDLKDKISKLTLNLDILKEKHDNLEIELTDMKELVQNEKIKANNLEEQNTNSLTSVKELEQRQNDIIEKYRSEQANLNSKINDLENNLQLRNNKIQDLENQILISNMAKSDERTQIQDELVLTTQKLNEIKGKLGESEKAHSDQKQLNIDLQKDVAILKAKLQKHRLLLEEKEASWKDEKCQLQVQIDLAEERIKDNRLELEGKLEKMKTKMRSIYHEEINKERARRDEVKTQLQALVAKNEQYELHVQKLSKQIFELNEKNLELQKENKFMETKLKDYESYKSAVRRPHYPTHLISSELRMEDEEGEIFNNTYLADLKCGRLSPYGRDSISLQELQYRNSLVPPHLRSTYSAQYLTQNSETDDFKDDIPISLDDSLSTLLNTGQRKKMTGTTSYKKPGPPTPSKKAGRLSFGGSENHPREILKESNDSSSTSAKKTTPAKWSFFSRGKDENSPPKRRSFFKKK